MASDQQEISHAQGESLQRLQEIVDPDLIKQFLQLQIDEISIRQQQLELQKNQQENVHEVSNCRWKHNCGTVSLLDSTEARSLRSVTLFLLLHS